MNKKEEIEEWRDVPGYEGKYQISNFGNVKTLERKTPNKVGMMLRKEKLLKQWPSVTGYLRVKLYKDKTTKNTISVHKLVADVFLYNPDNYKEINHIDGIKSNNYVGNLERCSRSHNVKETYRLGLKKPETYQGSASGTSKLTEEQVLSIREEYSNKLFNQRQLADKYNVGTSLIHMIVHNQIWKHILNQQEV